MHLGNISWFGGVEYVKDSHKITLKYTQYTYQHTNTDLPINEYTVWIALQLLQYPQLQMIWIHVNVSMDFADSDVHFEY